MSREYEPSQERSAEALREANERSQELGERLARNPEHYSEEKAHHAMEMARNDALREALFSKEQGKEKHAHHADHHRTSVITKEEREASFEQTMVRVRKELPPSLRPFSKFIHRPLVERTSEFIGKTIARPHAILAGGITAFVTVLGLYFYAKFVGFTLQGSETIIAFVIGWACGIVFDLIKSLSTGKS